MSGIAEEIRKYVWKDSWTEAELEYIEENYLEWLRWQQGEIERLREEMDESQRLLKNELQHAVIMARENERLTQDIVSLRSQLAEKDKVLEWYADPYNHTSFERDFGAKAKRVLTKYKEAETV